MDREVEENMGMIIVLTLILAIIIIIISMSAYGLQTYLIQLRVHVATEVGFGRMEGGPCFL